MPRLQDNTKIVETSLKDVLKTGMVDNYDFKIKSCPLT